MYICILLYHWAIKWWWWWWWQSCYSGYTYKMAIVSWPQTPWRHFALFLRTNNADEIVHTNRKAVGSCSFSVSTPNCSSPVTRCSLCVQSDSWSASEWCLQVRCSRTDASSSTWRLRMTSTSSSHWIVTNASRSALLDYNVSQNNKTPCSCP